MFTSLFLSSNHTVGTVVDYWTLVKAALCFTLGDTNNIEVSFFSTL